MKQSPAFQFYPTDFTGSGKVGTMTTEEVGVYVLLLCLDWNEIGFEFDERRLARWCRLSVSRFRRNWQTVSKCFTERDGRMFNPRLELERVKQAEWRAKSRKGGLASVQARAKGGSTVVQPQGQPNVNTLSPSPSLTKRQQHPVADAPVVKIDHSWPAEGAACWVEMVGRMSAGRFGKVMKPFVDKHGWPVVRATMVRWIIERNALGKPAKIEWFADEAAAQIALPPQEILDEYGGLTQYGKRLVAGVK